MFLYSLFESCQLPVIFGKYSYLLNTSKYMNYERIFHYNVSIKQKFIRELQTSIYRCQSVLCGGGGGSGGGGGGGAHIWATVHPYTNTNTERKRDKKRKRVGEMEREKFFTHQ